MPVVGESASSSRDTASSPPVDAPMAAVGMDAGGARGPSDSATPAADAGAETAGLLRRAAVTVSVSDFPMIVNCRKVVGFRVVVRKCIGSPGVE